MSFSLIIPAHNEGPYIRETLALLSGALDEHHKDAWEIIVVDNASSDGTAENACGVHERIRVVTENQKGKGNALRRGGSMANGDIIAYTDADLPIDPSELIWAMESVEKEQFSVIVGSRLLLRNAQQTRRWWRTLTSRLFNFARRRILGIPVSDSQCPLKVFSRENLPYLLQCKEGGWYIDAEFLFRLFCAKVNIHEIPITWIEHRFPERKSKLSMIRDGAMTLIALLRIRLRGLQS